MILKRISILNYKNLEEAEIDFSAKLNCFFRPERHGENEPVGCGVFLVFLQKFRQSD